MIGIIYSTADSASSNMAKHIINTNNFEMVESDPILYLKDNITIVETNISLAHAEFIDKMDFEVAYFLSKHSSKANIPSFTTHPMGNWNARAEFGGSPKSLAMSAPVEMLRVLQSIHTIALDGLEKTYEATHHGPLVETPSMFVELGGKPEIVEDKRLAEALADAFFMQLMKDKNETYKKAVIGIGCTHYPEKFSNLAIEKEYAFAHIMPKHSIYNEDGTNNLDMLEQAIKKSSVEIESAVIEWKGLNSFQRKSVIRRLEELGIKYEKI